MSFFDDIDLDRSLSDAEAPPAPVTAGAAVPIPDDVMTPERQKTVTPAIALERLLEGNARFVADARVARDYSAQVAATANQQAPHSAILGCIDSRVPHEILFDQGIGDVFSTRVAGNVVTDEVLGSLEFAVGVAGARLVLVLGHTRCGAVGAACQGAGSGHIESLTRAIAPAVEACGGGHDPEAVARRHVANMVAAVRERSPVIRDLEMARMIAVRGAIYDVATGSVELLDDLARADT